MQVEFSLFCTAAEVTPNGLIYILRGGYDIISVPEFPEKLGGVAGRTGTEPRRACGQTHLASQGHVRLDGFAAYALFFLNDPLVADLATALAERIVREVPGRNTCDRIGRLYEITLGRPPTLEEFQIGLQLA